MKGTFVPAGLHDGLDVSGVLAWDGEAQPVKYDTLAHLFISHVLFEGRGREIVLGGERGI